MRNDLSIYDTVAPWWDPSDPLFAPLRALAPARLAYLDRIGLSLAGRAVLDVGCGGGYMTAPLAAAGASVVGVDVAQGALDAAALHLSALGLTASLRLGDGTSLPAQTDSVDLVVCTDVLVHVPDPRALVQEIGRVLRPGGTLLVSTINRTWLSRVVMITLGEDLLGLVHRGTHDPAKFIRPSELSGWLEDGGMRLAGLEGVGPVWINRRGRLTFGRHPTTAVMVQGHALACGISV